MLVIPHERDIFFTLLKVSGKVIDSGKKKKKDNEIWWIITNLNRTKIYSLNIVSWILSSTSEDVIPKSHFSGVLKRTEQSLQNFT